MYMILANNGVRPRVTHRESIFWAIVWPNLKYGTVPAERHFQCLGINVGKEQGSIQAIRLRRLSACSAPHSKHRGACLVSYMPFVYSTFQTGWRSIFGAKSCHSTNSKACGFSVCVRKFSTAKNKVLKSFVSKKQSMKTPSGNICCVLLGRYKSLWKTVNEDSFGYKFL